MNQLAPGSQFSPGEVLGGDQLVSRLDERQDNPYIQTWQALAPDGQTLVLKICRFPDHIQLEPPFLIPSKPGFAPLLNYHEIEWQGKSFLVMRRPYYPARLMDLFPADAIHPPSRSLLDTFAILAQHLDSMGKELPRLNFDLSPGDLLMDGDSLVITDLGMSNVILSLELEYHKVLTGIQARKEPERGVPLLASYPSIETSWRRGRTDAQYALAALYVYFRSRFLVFEDITQTFPGEGMGLPLLTWLKNNSDSLKLYEETGQISLPMLPDAHEQMLVKRALAREPAERYASGAVFIEALYDLLT